MSFHQERLPAAIWLSLCGMNVAVTTGRLARHGWHDRFATLQIVFWGIMFLFHAALFSTRWTFEDDAVVQSRVGIWKRRVPYTEIVSVDPLRQGKAATVRYGGKTLFTQPALIHVQAHDMPGFLSQLEQRIPPGLVHM